MSSKTRLKSAGIFVRLIALVTIFVTVTFLLGAAPKKGNSGFKTINIIDAEQHYEVVTKSITVADAIALAGITLGENDIVSADLQSATKDGDEIHIYRSKLIYLETSGKVFEFYTNKNTVGEALLSEGFLLGKYDEVIPDVNTAATDGMTISVKRVYIELSEVTEEIPFETTTVDNPNEYMGYEKVLQDGVNALMEVCACSSHSQFPRISLKKERMSAYCNLT